MEAQAKLDRADEKNKRLIASMLRSPFILGLHADPEWLVMHGSAGERAAFVRLARRRCFLMLGGVALIVAVMGLLHLHPPPLSRQAPLFGFSFTKAPSQAHPRLKQRRVSFRSRAL